MHPANKSIDELRADCEIRRQRRSGPGGQHRNKVETGIFIRHLPTGVEAEATEQRSQAKNCDSAIERLRVKLAMQARTPGFDIAAAPSDRWLARVRGGRIAVSRQHWDFASLLAELLDVLAATGVDFREAATRLQCSRSQLTRLLSMEPRALALVNHWRAEKGQAPLAPKGR